VGLYLPGTLLGRKLQPVVTQLRDYRIAEGSLHRFVEEWRAGIVPLRRELGFSIDAAWTVDGESRFVWLLSHPGDWAAFEATDRAYHESPQRKRLEPNPARLIEAQTVSRLTPVEL
jgi:hypothetical protein